MFDFSPRRFAVDDIVGDLQRGRVRRTSRFARSSSPRRSGPASSRPRRRPDARALRARSLGSLCGSASRTRRRVALKVTHVHRIGGIGGSERHLLTLLPALAAKGVDVRFVGLDMPGADPFYDELEVPFERVSRPWQLRGALKRAQPDLVHTHLVHADVYGAVATRTPIVSTKHNPDPFRAGPWRFAERVLARRARRIIAISEAVRRFTRRRGRSARGQDRGHPLRARRAARAVGREPRAADPRGLAAAALRRAAGAAEGRRHRDSRAAVDPRRDAARARRRAGASASGRARARARRGRSRPHAGPRRRRRGPLPALQRRRPPRAVGRLRPRDAGRDAGREARRGRRCRLGAGARRRRHDRVALSARRCRGARARRQDGAGRLDVRHARASAARDRCSRSRG